MQELADGIFQNPEHFDPDGSQADRLEGDAPAFSVAGQGCRRGRYRAFADEPHGGIAVFQHYGLPHVAAQFFPVGRTQRGVGAQDDADLSVVFVQRRRIGVNPHFIPFDLPHGIYAVQPHQTFRVLFRVEPLREADFDIFFPVGEIVHGVQAEVAGCGDFGFQYFLFRIARSFVFDRQGQHVGRFGCLYAGNDEPVGLSVGAVQPMYAAALHTVPDGHRPDLGGIFAVGGRERPFDGVRSVGFHGQGTQFGGRFGGQGLERERKFAGFGIIGQKTFQVHRDGIERASLKRGGGRKD